MKLWWIGLLLLGAGVNGLIPVQYTWQMPLWMSAALIFVGGLIVIFSSAGNTQAAEPVQPLPPQCSDAHSDTASSKH